MLQRENVTVRKNFTIYGEKECSVTAGQIFTEEQNFVDGQNVTVG
jgi:hypothetical protein